MKWKTLAIFLVIFVVQVRSGPYGDYYDEYDETNDYDQHAPEPAVDNGANDYHDRDEDWDTNGVTDHYDRHDEHHPGFDPSNNDLPVDTHGGGDQLWPTNGDGNGNDIHQPPHARQPDLHDPRARPEQVDPYRPQESPGREEAEHRYPYEHQARPYDPNRPQPELEDKDRREYQYPSQSRPYDPSRPHEQPTDTGHTDQYGRPEQVGPYRPQELPYQPSPSGEEHVDTREHEHEQRQRYPYGQPDQSRPEERPTQPERNDPYGRPEAAGPYRPQELPYQPPASSDAQPYTPQELPYQPYPSGETHVDTREREREHEQRQRYPYGQPEQPRPEERPAQPERTAGPYRPQELPYQPPASGDVHPDTREQDYDQRQRYPYGQPEQPRPEETPAQPERTDPYGRPESVGPYRPQELPYQPPVSGDVQPDTRERDYDQRQRYPYGQPEQPRPEERPAQPERTDPYGRPDSTGSYRPQELPYQPSGDAQPDPRERDYESRQTYPYEQPQQPRPEERPAQPERTDSYGRPESVGPYRPQELPYQPPVSGDVQPDAREREYDPRQRYPYGQPEQPRPEERPTQPERTDPYGRPETPGPYRPQDLPYQPPVSGDVQPDTREREYDSRQRYPYEQPEQPRPEERPTQPESTDSYGRPESVGPYRPQELPYQPSVAEDAQPDTRERDYDPRERYPYGQPEQPRPEERPTQPERTDPYGRPETAGPYRPQELPYEPPVSGDVQPDTRERGYDPRQRYPYEQPEQPRPEERPREPERTDPYGRPEPVGPYRPQELPHETAPTDPYAQPEYPYGQPRPEEPEHRPYEEPYHPEEPRPYDRPDPYDPYGSEDPRRRPVDPRQRYPYDRVPTPSGSVIVDIPGLGSVSSQVKRTATTAQTIYTFSNVRYAESPRGQRRFQPPEPVKPWYGIHDGSRENSSCPAFVELRKVKSLEGYSDVEDCLRLTVHTKNVTGNLPVMVYVHGEFFFDGSAEEASPEYLLEKDVVLVGVDYRLAPFGFISTLSPNVPGNVAVLDVIESLKWVQRNIRHFGGDPSSVTVFGQGAGAALVHVLTFSPVVPPGLFHRVILQSGSALSPFFVTDDPLKHSTEIAKRAGCQVSNRPGSFDDCLMNLRPSQLLEAFMMYNQENEVKAHGNFGGFQLAVGDRNNVLPQQPRDLLRSWTGNSYPMIAGVTSNVGSFVYKKIAKLHERELLQQFDVDRAFKHIVDYIAPPSSHPQWQKTFRESMLLDPRTHNITYVAPSLIDLTGDVMYKTPVFDAAEMNWINQGAETFVYTFDFKGRYNRYNISTYRGLGFLPGVSLSDDNIYLFPYPLRVSGLVGWEQDVSRILVDLWTSFAEIGRPTSTYSSYVFWEPLSRPQGPYIKINRGVERGEDLRDELARTAAEVYRSRSRF